MNVTVDVDPDNIEVLKADDRGRVTIGAEYAGEDVRVAVLEVIDAEE
jgi:hypothetical protein